MRVNNVKAVFAMLVRAQVQHGQFILTSGRRTGWYVDMRPPLLQRPQLVAEVVLAQVDATQFDVVAGPTMSGALLALAIGMASGLPVAYTHNARSHGIESSNVTSGWSQPGGLVLVVDDVLTTGGSLARSIRRLQAARMQPTQVVVLLDRSTSTERIRDVPVTAVLRSSDIGEKEDLS